MSSKLDNYIKESEDLILKIEELKKKIGFKEKDFNELNKDFSKNKIGEEEYKDKLRTDFKDKSFIKEKEQIKKYLEKLKDINNEIAVIFNVKEKIKLDASLEAKEVKEFVKRLKKKKVIDEKKYSTYTYNLFGKYSNSLFDNFSKDLTKKYPDFFKPLYHNLRLANIRIFSNTYINISLAGGFLAFILSFILGLFLFEGISVLKYIQVISFSLFIFVLTLVIFFYYPNIIVDNRRREIKNDLPFAILHMAAVAGSGARLIDVFAMLLQSGEYKALSGEIKRIMNYVHLFGYNLTTALKSISQITPSPDFKELLNGMISTIESGGSIKNFLKSKAEDTMNTYRLERKKYVEVLSTYSDIYTAILIAAPLLFIIVLVMINIIGSKLGGLDISFIQKLGTFVIVPALNIGFIVFMNIVQPDLWKKNTQSEFASAFS